jgi:hypothetical protein
MHVSGIKLTLTTAVCLFCAIILGKHLAQNCIPADHPYASFPSCIAAAGLNDAGIEMPFWPGNGPLDESTSAHINMTFNATATYNHWYVYLLGHLSQSQQTRAAPGISLSV